MSSEKLKLSLTYPQQQIYLTESPRFRIVTKGRRFGATQGGAICYSLQAAQGLSPILWVDTINGNIDRYFDRFFLPVLKQLKKKGAEYKWHQDKRLLKINGSIIDFRSVDNPQNIEGFGYKKIFLNEAGIILKDDYLFSHAILPMLIDYSDSKLIAAGVPKGKHKKDGTKHKFFELYEDATGGKKGYDYHKYSSFDNPFLSHDVINDLMSSMSEIEIQQEIYGEFVEYAGENPFAHKFTDGHIVPFEEVGQPLRISTDFNINPFGAIFGNYYQEGQQYCIDIFNETEVKNGNIDLMAERILDDYRSRLQACNLTGDAMGKNRNISERDNASNYLLLQRKLNLSGKQIIVPPNPTHENSRSDVNYALTHFRVRIHPRCVNLIRDLRTVQCDAFGQIIKRDRKDVSQRADFLDCFRYFTNTFAKRDILAHQKRFIR